MFILQIEHPVPDFNGWKKAFDGDPVDRKGSGVKRYTIFRKNDNPNYVIINLEFDHLKEAEGMLVALQKLWNRIEGKVMTNPQAKIIQAIETKTY